MGLIRGAVEGRGDERPGALHHLRATPATVHWGYFDAALAPALRVRSGDLIQAEAGRIDLMISGPKVMLGT